MYILNINMEEQPQLENIIKRLYAQGLTKERIIELLLMIIKQQMLYGGSLEEKIDTFFS
jgi:hypothetical protein